MYDCITLEPTVFPLLFRSFNMHTRCMQPKSKPRHSALSALGSVDTLLSTSVDITHVIIRSHSSSARFDYFTFSIRWTWWELGKYRIVRYISLRVYFPEFIFWPINFKISILDSMLLEITLLEYKLGGGEMIRK